MNELQKLVDELDALIAKSLGPLDDEDRAYIAMIEERERHHSMIRESYKAFWMKQIYEAAMLNWFSTFAISQDQAGEIADSPIIVSR